MWIEKQQAVVRAAKDAYTWAVNNGIAKEQARAVLPEGNTESRLYMNGTLRSWIHFIELRKANGTQKEHQLVALACAKAIAAIFPMAENLSN
jgi:thymidylate synthase (FAD)